MPKYFLKLGLLLLLLVAAGVPARAAEKSAIERGSATVYAQMLVGHRTANGEHLDGIHLTAAHRSLPMGTIVEVTNRKNGRKTKVRINDRGPHRRHAVIDLSPAAAKALGIRRTAPVELRVAKAS
jgi:rare lipoprotein A